MCVLRQQIPQRLFDADKIKRDRLDVEIKESNQKLDKVKDQIMAVQSSAQDAAAGNVTQ